MSTETFSISSGTFGLIVGAITLLGLTINFVRFHLPTNKIKVLESLLEETDTFFKKALEDGLLTDPTFVRETEQRLEILKHRTGSLQATVYNATTLTKDYTELFRGTSRGIGRACESLTTLRAEVLTSSEEGRRKLMEMNSAPHPFLPIVPLNPRTQVANRRVLPPAAEISRPQSCPISFSPESWDDTKSIATSNPLNGPMQAGADVQSTDVQDCASIEYTSTNLESEDLKLEYFEYLRGVGSQRPKLACILRAT